MTSADSGPEQRATNPLRRNVPLLGLSSLLNDTASEMAYWVLPFFLTSIGAGPRALGVIEGVAESAANLVRLGSGYLADRFGRRKPLIVIGYVLANAVKPLLGFAQHWSQVLGLRALDRTGKGIRGAPRDVMISESADPGKLGAAYGLRQAMDSVGAILGPALAFAILWGGHHNVRQVFWMAAIPGALTVAVVLLGVRETGTGQPKAKPSTTALPRSPLSQTGWRPVLQLTGIPLLLLSLGLFGLANFSDMFLVLRAHTVGTPARDAPLLGLLFNVVFAGLSFPMGRISDRIARKWVLGLGLLVFAAVHLGFALVHSSVMVWPLFAGYGIYHAMTQGARSALVADLTPREMRGRTFGLVSALTGTTALVSSILAGMFWARTSPTLVFGTASVLAAVAAIGIMLLPAPASAGGLEAGPA